MKVFNKLSELSGSTKYNCIKIMITVNLLYTSKMVKGEHVFERIDGNHREVRLLLVDVIERMSKLLSVGHKNGNSI